ncbi:MAG: methyltransferase [Gammaproteobacteria bacterium]
MKTFARNRVLVKLYHMLLSVIVALQRGVERLTPAPFRLMQTGSLFWKSRALYVATRLGLADALGDTQKDTREIAAALHLYEDPLYRLLRMLTTMGIFEETSPRVFRNSATSAYLRADNPKNVRALILMHNAPPMTRPWMEPLEECLRSGEVPFQQANGAELFAYMDQDRDFDLLFSQAMDAVENLTGNAYLDDFNWAAFARIIDVGGSAGSKSLAILTRHPTLKAVVFDRPQIIDAARAALPGKVAEAIRSRIEFQSGDMFEQLPAAQSDLDLYMFFALFHGMNDEEALRVLHNLRAAFGRYRPSVLMVDSVAEDMHINATVAAFDMQMLIGTRGRERTYDEWQRLLEDSGFEIVEVIDVRSFAKFILARPA